MVAASIASCDDAIAVRAGATTQPVTSPAAPDAKAAARHATSQPSLARGGAP
jgi:hypothetical protein